MKLSPEMNAGEGATTDVVARGTDERTGEKYVISRFRDQSSLPEESPDEESESEVKEKKEVKSKGKTIGQRIVGALYKFGLIHSSDAPSRIPWQDETPTVGGIREEEWEKPRVKPQISSNPENKKPEDKVEDTEEESVLVPAVEEEKVHKLVAAKESKITHSSTPLGAGEGVRKQAIRRKDDQTVLENDVPDLKPREVLKSESDFDRNKKVKAKKKDNENTTETEDQSSNEEDEAKRNAKEEKELLAIQAFLDKGKDLIKRGFGALVDNVGRLVPDKVYDFIEAHDVTRTAKKTEVFKNRKEAIKRNVELTHRITEKNKQIGDMDSSISRQKGLLSDAKKEMNLRIELASGDEELIRNATEEFEAHNVQINERIAELESQKVPLVAERKILLSQKQSAKQEIRDDNSRLRIIVEGKVENLKAEVGYEQIVADRESLKLKLETKRSELSKLEAKISAYEATIKRGGYDRSRIKLIKATLAEIRENAKSSRDAVSKLQGAYDKVNGITLMLQTRFSAMTDTLRKMGVIDEAQVARENEVQRPEIRSVPVSNPPQTNTNAGSSTDVTGSASSPDYVPGNDYADPNELPQYVYENMMADDQPLSGSSKAEQVNNGRENLAKISKGQFDNLLKGVERNDLRPKGNDISKLLGHARNYIDEKGLKSSLIEDEVNALKAKDIKRDEQIRLLKAIQSKLK